MIRIKDNIQTEDVIILFRIRFVQMLLGFIVVSGLLMPLINPTQLDTNQSLLSFAAAGIAVALLVMLLQRQNFVLIMNATVALLAAMTFIIVNNDPFLIAMMILTLTAAAILTNMVGFALINVTIAIRLALHITLFTNDPLISILLPGSIPFLAGLAIRYFAYTVQNTINQYQRTSERLAASTSVGQVMSQLLIQKELLPQAAGLIRDQFAFSHVQIYLLNQANDSAELLASTNEKSADSPIRIKSGSPNPPGQVMKNRETILFRNTEIAHAYTLDHLLPQIRSELAVPIQDTDSIIGVLDIQSTEINAFTPTDIQAFQIMASQLATAIRNSRLFETQVAGTEQNKRLIDQLREALSQVERLNERLTGRVWAEYLRNQPGTIGLDVDFDKHQQETNTTWLPTLEEAIQQGQLTQVSDTDRQVITVPLRVRGQVVGAMEFELDEPLSEEQQMMMADVEERFGLAAENVRLLEQTQRSAQREAIVSEISSRLQSTNNVEATLAEAARSLHDTLKAKKVSIRLKGSGEDNGVQP